MPRTALLGFVIITPLLAQTNWTLFDNTTWTLVSPVNVPMTRV